jgi:hypothetical protein
MATYAFQSIDFHDRGAVGTTNAVMPGLPPGANQVFDRGDLVVITGGTVNQLTNGAVANIALAAEKNPDTAYLAPGPDFSSAKPAVAYFKLKGRQIKISTGGAAFNPATHLGVNRGVKRDATTGRTYIDLTDSATPAFNIRARVLEYMQATDKSWGIPTTGDTGVRVVAVILDSAAYDAGL